MPSRYGEISGKAGTISRGGVCEMSGTGARRTRVTIHSRETIDIIY